MIRTIHICPCGCRTRGEHKYGFCDEHAARLAVFRVEYEAGKRLKKGKGWSDEETEAAA